MNPSTGKGTDFLKPEAGDRRDRPGWSGFFWPVLNHNFAAGSSTQSSSYGHDDVSVSIRLIRRPEFRRAFSVLQGNLDVPVPNDAKQVKQGLEDIFWSLLNSREFLFNH